MEFEFIRSSVHSLSFSLIDSFCFRFPHKCQRPLDNFISLFQTRLGPKPFSSEAAEISFDKVFSVPTAPTSEPVAEAEEPEPMAEVFEPNGDDLEEPEEAPKVDEPKIIEAIIKVCIFA